MDPATKLRDWARRCREQADRTEHPPTAEALRRLAGENEAAARVFETPAPARKDESEG